MESVATKTVQPDHVLSAQRILAEGIKAADGPVALACSFSAEDIVVLDLLRKIAPDVTVFALDTGRLNEETYLAAESVRAQFSVEILWYFPDAAAVEHLERTKGLYSFRESLDNRKECCRIRKVEPLGRALKGLSGWVTGMRAGQSATRTDLAEIETDPAHGDIVKINPLAEWTAEQVFDYVAEHQLPRNKLYDAGYTSIGCAPCTRPVRPGEDERAGRWWWEDAEHKECGLHAR